MDDIMTNDSAQTNAVGSQPKSKQELRQWMRARLKQASAAELKQADELICQRLRELLLFKQAGILLCYAPMGGELGIWPLLTELLNSGRRLCLPLITGPGVMEARQVNDLTELKRNSYGIAEPPPESRLVLPAEIDLVLVPGLAFSRDLWRMGRGGGYYDRYLAACPAFRLGLTRELQVVAQIPHDAQDMPMDALLTERGYWANVPEAGAFRLPAQGG